MWFLLRNGFLYTESTSGGFLVFNGEKMKKIMSFMLVVVFSLYCTPDRASQDFEKNLVRSASAPVFFFKSKSKTTKKFAGKKQGQIGARENASAPPALGLNREKNKKRQNQSCKKKQRDRLTGKKRKRIGLSGDGKKSLERRRKKQKIDAKRPALTIIGNACSKPREASQQAMFSVKKSDCHNIFKMYQCELKDFTENNSGIKVVKANGDGNCIIAGHEHGDVSIFDISDPKNIKLHCSYKHDFPVFAVCISHDGTLCASGDEKGKIQLYKKNGLLYEKKSEQYHDIAIDYMALCENNRGLVSKDVYGNIILLDLATNKHKVIREGNFSDTSDRVVKIATDKYMRTIVVGLKSGRVIVYDNTGEIVHEYTHKKEVECLSVAKNGKMVFSGGGDGVVMCWNLTDKSAPLCRYEHNRRITCLYNKNERYLISGDADGVIMIYDKQEKNGCKLEYRYAIRCLFLTGDETLLFIGKDDGEVVIYNFVEKKDVITYTCDNPVECVCPTNVGRCFAVGEAYSDGYFEINQLLYSGEENKLIRKSIYKEKCVVEENTEDELVSVQSSSDCNRFIALTEDGILTICENPPHVAQRNARLKNKENSTCQIFQDEKDRSDYLQDLKNNTMFDIVLQDRKIKVNDFILKLIG